MAKVQPMAAHLQTITAPAPLRSLPGWLIWRYEHAEGEAKPRKIPYYSSGARRFGIQGSAKDRAALVSFDVAKRTAAVRGFDGVGLALLEDFGITALDFDDCVGAEGLDPQVEAMLAGTYAEFSPSGKGVRAFVAGDLGNRKSFANATQYGFETFHSKGFVTFTGIPLEITEMTGSENVIAQPSAAVKALHAARFSASNTEYSAEAEPIIGLTEDQLATCLAALSPDMPHDEWLHVGMGLHHETCGDGFELWDTWSSQGTGYPGRETLEHRWLSFGQSGVRPVTARSLVRKAEAAGAPISIDTAAVSEFHLIPEQPAPPGGYFNIRSAGDFVQSVQPISWLIKGFLPKAILPPPPPELQGQQLSVELVSMLAQAQRAVATNGIDRFTNGLTAMAQIKPEVLDKFDADRWAEEYGDALGINPDLVLPEEQVQQLRKQRAQAQAQAAKAQQMNVASQTAKNLGATPTDGGNAASSIMDMFSQGFGSAGGGQ